MAKIIYVLFDIDGYFLLSFSMFSACFVFLCLFQCFHVYLFVHSIHNFVFRCVLFVCLFVGVSVCLFFIIYVFLHHSPLHLLFGCAFCSSLYIHDIGLSVPFVVGCRCHFCHILEHWGLI